ncbi:CDP-alcohol phosphatidyltransferase family protein [Streptococcus suis]|uniref:CDP-alcohol phosphatidyltransferase family protein n=1 Tax=Streptococcus suis TaxID=1307 RepID=UPI0030101784
MKILIQLISLFRALAAFVFILYHGYLSEIISTCLILTALFSDLLDGYLAKKYKLESTGGQLLDLFSDKYLNFIAIIYLILAGLPLLPLVLVLTKEIFVLSFRSLKINNQFIISTNRVVGGCFTAFLFLILTLQINKLLLKYLPVGVLFLGITNLFYLIYKIMTNRKLLRDVFKNNL